MPEKHTAAGSSSSFRGVQADHIATTDHKTLILQPAIYRSRANAEEDAQRNCVSGGSGTVAGAATSLLPGTDSFY